MTHPTPLVPDRSFWRGLRVLVTGGAGFIGSSVADALRARGVPDDHILIPRFADCDLRDPANCRRAVRGCDIVLHLAASTGGIAFSRAHPASQYRDCTLIDIQMLEATREAGLRKFVSLGNLLAYPAAAHSPLMEECLHDGHIAASHLGIGLAKRNFASLAEMYHREYGLNVITLLSANAYGPRDRFDPARSHVIPATIIKCFRDEDLVVWGDGTPTRDFLYVDDIAEGMLLAAEFLPAPGYVNLSSGIEVSIGDVVRMIARISGFRKQIIFDHTKGGGDPRRVASTERATALLGFVPKVSMENGLSRTIDFYRKSVAGRPAS